MFKIVVFLLMPLIFFLLPAEEVQAGINQQYYDLQTYTNKDGLSQVSINDIVLDDEGFLWIATQSGLNRFDGSSFHTFDNADYAKENCGNYINVLIADGNRIWIGTRDAGLCYFDKKEHRFHNIEVLRNINIEDMVMDSFNNLYMTMENKGIGFIAPYSNINLNIIPFFIRKNINVTTIYISPDGILWVGTKEGRLFYAELKNNPLELNFNEFVFTHNADKIFVISSHNADELWVGTQKELFRINLKTSETMPVTFNKQQENTSVIYELKWQNDILWIGTGAGLYEYDAQKQMVINKYIHQEHDLSSISNNVVYSILPDKHGQLWVGTGKYLNLFYKNTTFNKIQNTQSGGSLLNSNIVFSILKNNNDLWVGTSGGGINLLRGQKNFTFTKESHQLPSNICFSLLSDKNRIWAGTREGLVIINNCNESIQEMEVQNIFHNPSKSKSLSCNFIRYLYKDSANNIWLCTSGGGLNRFTGDLSKNIIRFKQYRNHPKQPNTIASDKVNYILETEENQYWIATDKGLNILTIDSKHNIEYFSRLTINDETFLDKEVVYTLLKDRENGIWIGTTNGLYYWKNHLLINYNIQSGLPDNVIYGIMEDFNGAIWVSTNKGLSCFDKRTKSFTNYHQSDGLSSEEYDLHAKFIDDNGMLYFGGIDGISWFNPQEFKEKSQISKLFIENIQITNAKNNSTKTFYPENNQQISIRKNQFPITVNYSAINLLHDKNIIFAYRLLPDNPNWNIIENKKFIQLLSLPPNSYTLEIQALNHGKIKPDNKTLHIPITVVPFWWQSAWAYFLYSLIIILIIILIFRFSLKRKMEHQENLRLKELDSLKSRLYANITHEFRTPLTVIKGMADEITDAMNLEEQKHFNDKIEMIGRNSDKLLHLVQQMLDMSKIEDGKMKFKLIRNNIVSYLQYVLESFQSMADAKQIKLVFYHETNSIIMDYDQDKIFVTASNLLTNAIKFTSTGGKVIFHVKKERKDEKDQLIIKVQDSGIGIGKEHLEHIFDRFYQIGNSMLRKNEGTGIGLALTKEIVALMKGEITVKSTVGKRTEFCVSIPITKNAPLQKPKPLVHVEEKELRTLEVISETENENLPLALIVEDNPDVAKYIISCLTEKYRIKWASDGNKGVIAAIETIPDIIILDVIMPGKDGFEVCDILKKEELTSHIPIILLTAKATDSDRIEGLSHGADAYLTKPFNKKELFVRLEQLIKIRRALQKKFSKVEISLAQQLKLTGEELFLKKAIEAIEKQMDNPKLDPSLLAESLNLSESQLYRKLKALSSKSTAVFIRGIRLSAAKKLLATTSLHISEIAYQCGFNNPAWFSRVFKEEFGVSPSEQRK